MERIRMEGTPRIIQDSDDVKRLRRAFFPLLFAEEEKMLVGFMKDCNGSSL